MPQIRFILASLLLISLSSCSKNDNCDNPIDCLPSQTQKGENTLGCLINNKVFKPGGSTLAATILDVEYRVANDDYYFILEGNNTRSKQKVSVILNEKIEENVVYKLVNFESDTNSGNYTVSGDLYWTNNEVTGELIFSKIALDQGFVSGTFWFDAENSSGEIVEIRNGVFDLEF